MMVIAAFPSIYFVRLEAYYYKILNPSNKKLIK